MTTVQQIYEEMQRIAPLALAESWDNPGLLVDCGGEVSRVLVTLDITPEVVEEAARKGCGLIVSHHPVIFSPLKKMSGQDVAFQLVKNGISRSVCTRISTPPRAASTRCWPGSSGCGRWKPSPRAAAVWAASSPSQSPSWQKRHRKSLPPAATSRPTACGAGQVRRHRQGGAAAGRHQRAGGSLFEDAIAQGADCLLTGEANHHHAIDAKRLGLRSSQRATTLRSSR